MTPRKTTEKITTTTKGKEATMTTKINNNQTQEREATMTTKINNNQTQEREATMSNNQTPFNGKFNASELIGKTGKIELEITQPTNDKIAQRIASEIWNQWRTDISTESIRLTLDATEPTDPTAKNQPSFVKRYRKAWIEQIKPRYAPSWNIAGDVFSTIGNVYAKNTRTGKRTVYYKVTDDIISIGNSYTDPETGQINPSYGNPSYSCWWGSYGNSPDTLESVNGLGVLVYTSPEMQDYHGIARMWLVTDDNGYLIGFNPYADLADIAESNDNVPKKLDNVFKPILMQLLNLQDDPDRYRFTSADTEISDEEMYINNSRGYCLQHVDSAHYPTFELDALDTPGNRCADCGDYIAEDETYHGSDGQPYCNYHFNERFAYCSHCDEVIPWENTITISGEPHCEYCADLIATPCDCCSDLTRNDELQYLDDYELCDACFSDYVTYCDHCGDEHHPDNMDLDHPRYCPDCAEKLPETTYKIITATHGAITPEHQTPRLLDPNNLPTQQTYTRLIWNMCIDPLDILRIDYFETTTGKLLHILPWSDR